MALARSINPSAPKFFSAQLSPYSKQYKAPRGGAPPPATPASEGIDTAPRKLEWSLTPELNTGIRFAETRLSDLICQNDCQALEFKTYGRAFMIKHGFSPDAFVQMAFQAAYYGLYGRIECTYEPAMTKTFLHGRTEAIRTVQPASVNFTKTFFSSDQDPATKIAALRKACESHVKLTKECSQGLGQDRHLYALYCLLQREIVNDPSKKLPQIFTDPGWSVLNTSILSTSNCGNPALRLFGFGPVAADGYGLGYIIREDGLSVCAASKHLQTRRFLDTLNGYLMDVHNMLRQIYRKANERPAPWVDHAGNLRDPRTGMKLAGIKGANGALSSEEEEEEEIAGYSFFDSSVVDQLNKPRVRAYPGKILQIAEY